jgi:transcriptional regulator with PAS, ATPase and Fis domain
MVRQGSFREDLYYRINVVKLVLPPLRDRKDDIPLLAHHFLRKFSRISGKEIQGFSPDVLPRLMVYDFPGNIRELENIIEYATVVCRENIISLEHLPDSLNKASFNGESVSDPVKTGARSWTELERHFIYESLKMNNWNRSATAAQLGIHPSTLWRKIKQLNLNIPGRTTRSPRS